MRVREFPASFPDSLPAGADFYDTGEDAYLHWPGEGWYRVEAGGLVPASGGDPPTDVIVRGLPVTAAEFAALDSVRPHIEAARKRGDDPGPILLVGGSGIVGRWTARSLRGAYPDAPLLIGGRDLARAEAVAAELGGPERGVEAVAIDLTAEDLGLGDRPVRAVAVLFTDESVAGLRFAQSRGAPYVNISPGINELGPEVAAYIHAPDASAVVLGTEWLVGATTIPTLEFAKEFGRVDEIAIGALLDEEDAFGPAANADLERQTKTAPAALARREGRYVWRVGDDATGRFRAVDGTEMPAAALSPNDVLGLANAIGAPNVRFDLAVGVSSARRRGEPPATEIVIELAGEDHEGKPLRTRHAVVHPEGQMPLTGLGVAMVLERLAGLDGATPTPPGLYFPYQLLDPDAYLARLAASGGAILTLEPG